jgi:dynein heavy chain
MGGAPAGPARTGKTERVKDLARSLGQVCFAFNSSGQMDIRSLAATFEYLSQSGAWGCFDEFIRIAARALSDVSNQVKLISVALRENIKNLILDEILLILKQTTVSLLQRIQNMRVETNFHKISKQFHVSFNLYSRYSNYLWNYAYGGRI